MVKYLRAYNVLKAYSDFQSEMFMQIGKLGVQIAELPEIDIIHCGECKHYGTEDDYDMCRLTRILRDDDWFCADGEKKDDNNRY